MKYVEWFGCSSDANDSDEYTCKAYQPKTEYTKDGMPRFGGGERAWVYHMDPDLDTPVEYTEITLKKGSSLKLVSTILLAGMSLINF